MRYALALLLCLLPALASAQTYTTSSMLAWNASSNAMDVADAQSFTIRLYVNRSATPIAVTGVTCSAPVPPATLIPCTAPVPSVALSGLNRRKAEAYITEEDTTTPVSGEMQSNVFIVNRRPNGATSYRQVP